MKLLTIISMTLLATVICKADEIVDTYDLTMTLKVPRIYNNTKSLGYRRDQTQRIKGQLLIKYIDGEIRPIFEIKNLVNRSHKIAGKYITYETIVDNEGEYVYPRFNYIGSNKSMTFNKGKILFFLDANPSYNVGLDEPDNTLLITLAGTGISTRKNGVQYVKKFKGTICGSLGCGCSAYGHTSPTRIAGPYGPTDIVDDVASIEGKWKAKYVGRTVKK